MNAAKRLSCCERMSGWKEGTWWRGRCVCVLVCWCVAVLVCLRVLSGSWLARHHLQHSGGPVHVRAAATQTHGHHTCPHARATSAAHAHAPAPGARPHPCRSQRAQTRG
jgi:ABC-type nickel/cobalt efflux system permease component RcnA